MRLRPQLFVARNLMSQARYAEARKELNVLVEAQEARRSITGKWASYEAWERAWRYLAEMDLAVRLGHMDRAASYLPLAEEECALAEAGRGVASLAYVRRNIQYMELRILLGSGRIADLLARIRAARRDLEDGSGADAEMTEKLDGMEVSARSFGVMRGLLDAEETLAFMAPIYEDESQPVSTRFEAAYRSAHLLSIRGDLSRAQAPLALARQLASRPQQRAELASIAGRLAIQQPGPLDPDADEEWLRASAEYFELLGAAPTSKTGSGITLFSRRRQICSVGIELALARWPDEPRHSFDRFLNYERFSILPQRLKERYGQRDPLDLAGLQGKLLEPGDLVLAPILEDGSCLLFVATKDEASFLPLGPWLPLRDTLTQIDGWLRIPNPVAEGAESDQLKRAGEALTDLILPSPARRLIRAAKHLIVIESGLTQPLPLQLAQLDGVPLGLQKPMSRMPSLLAMWHRRPPEEHDSPGRSVLVANVSIGQEDSERLLGGQEPIVLTAQELERLRTSVNPPMRVLTAAEGSTEALAAGALEGSSLGVLIAHGVQDRSLLRTPTILLGSQGDDDGLWSCADVEDSSVSDVVLLASCRAGAGAARPGDNYANDLGGAFLLAGARAVVLSLGDLPQRATMLFTEHFSEALDQGRTVAEATRLAQLSVASQKDYVAPFFHSQLHVLGEGNYRPFPRPEAAGTPAPAWIALGSLALLLLASVGLLKRTRAGSLGQ